MKLQVFTIFDKAVNAYLPPFYARAQGEALRQFTDAVNDTKSNFNRHSTDYVLMKLGEFDDNTGLYECMEPRRVVAANEVLIEEPFREDNKVDGVTPIRRLPI